jgi:hypothetical protein
MVTAEGTGKRTGFNPATGKILQEMPNSAHFIDSLRDDETGEPPVGRSHFVDIYKPSQDTYKLTLVGLQPGTFSVSIHTFATDGTSQIDTRLPGIAGLGSVSTLEVHYFSSPGSPSIVARLATFTGMNADIINGLTLGLISNNGIANSLMSKIQAASAAAERGQNETAVNILGAFENEVSVQTSKHLIGIAPQVLQEDAASLISQLSH